MPHAYGTRFRLLGVEAKVSGKASGGYLHQRRQGWYLAVTVPPAARAVMGRDKLVRSLETRDRAEAQRRRWRVFSEMRAEIAAGMRGASSPSELDEAMRFRESILTASDEVEEGPDGTPLHDSDRDILESLAADRAERLHGARGFAVAKQWFDVATGKADPLKGLADKWLAELEGRATEQTRGQHEQALELLYAHSGESVAVHAVTKRTAGDFVAHLLKLPARPKAPPRKRRTIKRLVSSLSSLWRWLIQRGYAETNPWRDLGIGTDRGEDEEARAAFDEDHLLKLLKGTPSGHVRGEVLPDLIRLGMFTGARLNELCGLVAGDVREGAFFIPKGKTKAARRPVPIHPAVAEIVAGRTKGKKPDEPLFPELKGSGPDKKRGWNATKLFTNYRREVGVTGPTLVFHSFRHTVVTRLLAAGVEPHIVARLVGHTVSGVTFQVYDKGPPLKVLKAAMEKLRYPAVVMRAV